ncbi:hypothetical protein BKA70DRAFT_1217587 [Coprinopsis sp. MPI-PUGE-AT-0042]|nr:hypothetical protein BKA70DRAFT_1217587 [Coprinopsis sp. MPI-PUGE-AT-0042]
MKFTLWSTFVTFALTLQSHAYLAVEDGAFNVRHFHMVKRGENGEIVGRAYGSTYEIMDLEARKDCTTVSACGTPGGCMMMAAQTYCKGEDWTKGFQKAVKQTGANGMTGLKIMAEGIGRGPVGMAVGAAKATKKALDDVKKQDKKEKKTEKKEKKAQAKKEKKEKKAKTKEKKEKAKESKKIKNEKRSWSEDEDILFGRSDVYDFVERDEDMNLVQRGEFMLSETISRNQDGRLAKLQVNARHCTQYIGSRGGGILSELQMNHGLVTKECKNLSGGAFKEGKLSAGRPYAIM